jgi:DNA-directed RNA polymerase specialized sigma24 family protein
MGTRRTDHTRSATAAGFARLLERLGTDEDAAAGEYERLRLTLVKFFDWRGAWAPDECADETLDRLVAKLDADDKDDEIGDVRGYAHGIARFVLLERLRRQAQSPIHEGADPSAGRALWPPEPVQPLHECFERCLAALPAESRTLVVNYYVAEGQTKIDNRRRLARSLGISDNALRSRVLRLRDRLERCARSCAAAAETAGLDTALRHVAAVPNTVEMKGADDDRDD